MRRCMLAVLTVLGLLTWPAPALAQTAPFCRPGESPQFTFGFAALKMQLGPTMGEPIECAHPNSANGDVIQNTTTGLSFWRKSTNTPTFTDGWRHWGLTPAGMVAWEGSSIDPPGVAVAPPTVTRTRVRAAEYLPTVREMPPGFVASGADQVSLISDGELVSRLFQGRDGSTFGVIAARTQSPAGAGAACLGLVEAATERGYEAVSQSQRGDGGILLIGRINGQPATAVFFTLGVVCGSTVMSGPIIGTGTSDANAAEQFGHVLTVIERKARAYPDGYR